MWDECQRWESDWWGDCTNTLDEDLKQLSYFKRLGFERTWNAKTNYVFDMQGKRICDIGGGPSSFLLRCVNVKGFVLDPCEYPQWVYDRYAAANIGNSRQKGENIAEWVRDWMKPLDEVWMYNLLQHTENPALIVQNARELAPVIRVFDWLEQGVLPGHPQNLTEANMNHWFGQKGTVEAINENGCVGSCYYGVFRY